MSVTVDMTDELGWARLGLIQALRTLRDASEVRWHDGHLQLQPELLEVVRYALTGPPHPEPHPS